MKKFSLFLLIAFSLSNIVFSQIIIKQVTSVLPQSEADYRGSTTREITDFNKNWRIKSELSSENSTNISVPASFSSENSLVFEKEFNLTANFSENNLYKIHFLGISYSADIYLNDVIIFKKPAGNVPFSFFLPNDLLTFDSPNKLTLVITNSLDSKTTIPFFQRFLFPKDAGGILRDVFMETVPKVHLTEIKSSITLNDQLSNAELNSSFEITNADDNGKYKIEIKITDLNGMVASKKIFQIDGKVGNKSILLNVKNPKLWSPKIPSVYNEIVSLSKNDSTIDSFSKKILFVKYENKPNGIFLNGKKFTPKGVTYINSSEKNGVLTTYSELKNDLLLIKKMGVNSVRFAKQTPHPFALNICADIGLAAFIEIPLNSIPSTFTDDETYENRVEAFLSSFVGTYGKYPAVFAIGVGGGFISNDNRIVSFVNRLGKIVHTKSDKISYASFCGIPAREIPNIDLYGIELFGNTEPLKTSLGITSINRNKIFISEASYPNYNGNTNGYLNKFSLESQAKYFETIINESKTREIAGFFFNTMFDYYGDFSSPFTKYNPENKYSIGIVGIDRNSNTLSYKVINSKLLSGKRITIPLGSKTDDAPIFFILSGLLLALLMGILINSNKKFREDATRALLRPYNFYADIRDHRILSGFSTIILMIILSGAHALLISNLLYYFRDSVTFEKGLLSFGLPSFVSAFSYLAWNPIQAFFYSLAFGILFILFISWLFYIGSFPLKMKIYFRNIFFTVVWAVLPLSILLPVKMVLYRILETNIFNTYIFLFLGFYFLWIAQRVIKGIYVIFDISLSQAYFYTMIVVVFILGGIILYFQFSFSTLDFLLQAFYQSKLI